MGQGRACLLLWGSVQLPREVTTALCPHQYKRCPFTPQSNGLEDKPKSRAQGSSSPAPSKRQVPAESWLSCPPTSEASEPVPGSETRVQ